MKHRIHFTKMHGLGNDFILVDAINQRISDEEVDSLAKKLCNRNFGIGADGLVLVKSSDQTDLQMQIINADGSEPEMCGNGIRCFAKYVYDEKIIEKDIFSVETLAGIMVPGLILKEGNVVAVEVDMGEAILESSKIPVQGLNPEKVINESINIDNTDYAVTCVSMGNPHAIVFVDNLEAIDIENLGPKFEGNSIFPERINTEFVQVVDKNKATVRVWERGVGETLACGTGACAVTVAGVLNEKLERKSIIHLPGGELKIEWQETDNHVIMTGPASTVFKGEIFI